MRTSAGDLDKPKIAFFFDEAHLLFNDAPTALLEKIEQVVRLIRSKGVSVWFISQNPSDIPESVLGQVGNRVQHALRAYTPNEQKAIKYAANSFRANPAFDTEKVLQELEVGEAIVSVLDAKGVPMVVDRANILPPRSSMAAADASVISQTINRSPLLNKYSQMIDRESAYEILVAQHEQAEKEAAEAKAAEEEAKRQAAEAKEAEKQRIAEEKEAAAAEKAAARQAAQQTKTTASSRKQTTMFDKVLNSAASTVGREVGRSLIRGILGNLTK